ncbi:MAG: hypothetical protein ACREVX_14795 [Clostridium sp.]|uniref:hypothetical protein n=1 Tax=Clostridium sp. TaxID=1506 RepID=UPI003D6C81BD
MLVSETVYSEFGDKVLLTKGNKLTSKLIESLIKRGVTHVTVTERYTLDVDPIDVVRTEIKNILEKEIIRLARNIGDNLSKDEILLKICLKS